MIRRRKEMRYRGGLDATLHTDPSTLSDLVAMTGLTNEHDIRLLDCIYANMQKAAGVKDSCCMVIPENASSNFIRIVSLLAEHGHLTLKKTYSPVTSFG